MNTPKVKREKSDINLEKLIEQFGSDDKCRTHFEGLRWPEGVKCPRCESETVSKIKDAAKYDCGCGYQFTATTGTIFHDTHLPLWKWFLAIYMMTEAKKGISACQMQRTISVSYKTAWYLCHRIRAAIYTDEHPGYRGIADADTRHETVNHSKEEWVHGDVHTNGIESVWSLLKRSVVGTYHKVSVKHLDAYLDELEHRFNNRDNKFLFRDTLLKLVKSENLPYAELTSKKAA